MTPTGGVDLAQAQTDGRLVIEDDAPGLDGDGYTLDGVSRPVPGAPPAITALVPNTLAHTAKPQRIKITGTDFALGDQVMFGGATPPTSFVSDKELAVQFNPGDWSPGDLSVAVAFSARGPSNVVTFTVT